MLPARLTNLVLFSSLFALALGAGMTLLLEAGRRIGARRLARDPEGARTGLGPVEGAVFGLLGLLIAFTFSGAAERFDARRALIVEEANAIGTAWLRLDLLPDQPRAELRTLFTDYLGTRLAAYRALPDMAAAEADLERAAGIQDRIWSHAVAACREGTPQPVAMLLLPALNSMFDIAATRTAAAWRHPPPVVYVLLTVLSLASALLAGYAMAGTRSRSLLHMTMFALIMAASIYIILDLEYPRAGFIRVDDADRTLIMLLEGMKGR